jgi:hypothetical protein
MSIIGNGLNGTQGQLSGGVTEAGYALELVAGINVPTFQKLGAAAGRHIMCGISRADGTVALQPGEIVQVAVDNDIDVAQCDALNPLTDGTGQFDVDGLATDVVCQSLEDSAAGPAGTVKLVSAVLICPCWVVSI